jgi:hypothetical protein
VTYRLLGNAALLAAAVLAGGSRAAGAEVQAKVFPAGLLYPHYTADPRSPEFGMTGMQVDDPAIEDSGARRFGLKLGGRFGLLRLQSGERPEGAWQVDIHAGFIGQFDIDHSLDNIGWDGTYGFLASTRFGDGLSFQVGTKHVSAHVGDEYAERTGRQRIGYTREEAAAGLAWSGRGGARLYAEGGWGYSPKKDIGQEPGRVQLGGELHRAVASRERLGWYAAANFEAMEERDWSVDTSLHLGLRVPAGDRRWRIGVAFSDGKVPLGEFYGSEERSVALGLWLEP